MSQEQASAETLRALVGALREEQARLAAEVAALREEVAVLRAQVAPPPRERRAMAITLPTAGVAALAARALRIPLRLGPWALALAIGLAIAGLAELNVFQPVEVFTSRVKGWVREAAPVPAIAQSIVIVAVDDPSLTRLGPWGARWRLHHAQVLRNLTDAGARVVGFDIHFKTASPEFDPAFIAAIASARARGVRVVLAAEYDGTTNRLLEPTPALHAAATTIGSTYLYKDRVTNVVRYVAPFQQDRTWEAGGATRLVPALSTAVAMAAGKRAEELRPSGDGVVPINFAGASRGFERIPYVDVYDGRAPASVFKDRQVLVGVVFRSSRDVFDTPSESQVAGVLVHANALYTLLRGLPQRLSPLKNVGMLLAVTAVGTMVCLRFQRLPRIILVITVGAIYWAAALTLGEGATAMDLDLVPATLAIALVWAARVMAEKTRMGDELRRSLGLPSDAVQRLESEPRLLAGTLVKAVTVLAVDARNYSVFSHSHPPEHVREITAGLHQVIERVVYRREGYVNKFIGDAAIVVFGYPRSEAETATRAVLAAVEIHDGVRALREQWTSQGKTGIEAVRIGINTGPVSIGYQGSSKKQLDILGESIDLAARLEDAARDFHDALALISPATHALVKDHVHARRVGVTLKNMPHATTAYALEGLLETTIAAETKPDGSWRSRRRFWRPLPKLSAVDSSTSEAQS